MHHRTLPLILLAAFTAPLYAADGPSPSELKLREQLRATLLQLRSTETERANLQATQADLEQKLKDADTKVQALGKQLADDKTAADKTIAELTDKVAKRDGEIVQLKESLDKWKAAHAQITEVAKAKEAERSQFEAKSIAFERIVADQQRKNEAMYRLGTEILTRYERFGLGDALTSREPFIGITRVKFENLIQDYSDKLVDQVIKRPAPSAPPKTEKPAPPAKTNKPATPAKPAKKGARAVS